MNRASSVWVANAVDECEVSERDADDINVDEDMLEEWLVDEEEY